MIVAVSFLATYALSPIPFEESFLAHNNKNKNVLGEATSKNVVFTSTYKEHEYFRINDIVQIDNYLANIKIGPLSKGSTKKELFTISNEANNPNEIRIRFSAPINSSRDISTGLYIGEEKVSITDGVLERTIFIPANNQISIEIFYESNHSINYPLEFQLSAEIL